MRVASLALTLLLGAPAALAWNTSTGDPELGWQAVYIGNPSARTLPAAGWTKNEHTELTHVVLKELGIEGLFGIKPFGAGITVVDLNAALYHPQVGAEARVGDVAGTPLEERLVPPPAHFGGLPDYSWAVHDWINKNTLCPALPETAAKRDACYLFAGWMGMLNANHFGTQARLMYERYHLIARALGARAGALREALAAASFPADRGLYAEFVEEAEVEALIFESVGQHFLQDRWSTGHMWERWGSGNYRFSTPAPLSFFVALAAGLMHGSEGITKLPDPLGSPVVLTGSSGNVALPVPWRLPGLAPLPGVGDYRLADMHDGLFGAGFGFGDLPIDVGDQRARMFACAKAGFVEVIQSFGESEPGRFGLFGIQLPPGDFPDVLDDASCWEAWVTNAAIASGWLLHPSLLDIDKQARTQAVVATAAIGEVRERLVPLMDASWKISKAAVFDDPDGTSLATGGIGPIADVETGDKYLSVPNYTEPADLDLLDEQDNERGRDKHTVFGFFNRAHADWWCANLEGVLLNVRGSGHPQEAAACAYLADRAYKGTDPAYRGRRRELRRSGAAESDPICRFHGVETAGVDEELPYHLHPGYVASPGAQESGAHRSIVAWCRKAAVVDRAPCPDEALPAEGDDDWDVVARVGVEGGAVVLRGRNFGGAPGEVRAGADGGPYTVVVPVAATGWSDAQIRLDVPPNLLSEDDWFLQVCPGDDPVRCSVGRFILRVGGEQCLVQHPLVGLWTFTDEMSPPTSWSGYFFLPDGAVMSGSGSGAWFQIASWSVSGDTVIVEPCPYGSGDDNVREAPRFEGTWSAHPVTDDFGVVSCPRPNEDVCPAMKGTLAHVFPGGVELRRGTANTRFVGGNRGYFPIRSTTLQDFRCHGGCRRTWEFSYPHACGPIFQTCAGRRPPGVPFVCGTGVCPQGFECTGEGASCGCQGG